MAVIGVATSGMPRGIMVHYLAEDFWVDRDLSPMIYINPLIIETYKNIQKFSIIFHGKPTDIKGFSLTTKNDYRIVDIKKEGGTLRDRTIIIASELLTNNEYLDKETWCEYKGLDEGKPTLGLAKNISPILIHDIESINWVHHAEMEECSILEITLKNKLEKNQYYGLRMGVMLDPPRRISKLRRTILMSFHYKVHYCTFDGISPNDVNVIKGYLSNDKDQLAEIILNISDHPPGDANHPPSGGCWDTSSLAIYTYKGKLFGIELDYRLDESEPLACSKNTRGFRPFSTEKLDPPWRCYIRTQEHLAFVGLKGRENYNGKDLKTLQPDWDKKGNSPVDVIVDKFDSSKGLADFAIFVSILPFIYSLLDKILIAASTISFMLLKLIISIILTACIMLLVSRTIFGREVSD